MRNHATHLAPPRIKEQKKNNKNPFSFSFTFFCVAQNTLLLLVIYGGKCGLLQKNGGKLGTAVLQWGGVTNGSSPMLTVFNDWVVSACSTTYIVKAEKRKCQFTAACKCAQIYSTLQIVTCNL